MRLSAQVIASAVALASVCVSASLDVKLLKTKGKLPSQRTEADAVAEIRRIIAKYSLNSENYHKHTGKYLGFRNVTRKHRRAGETVDIDNSDEKWVAEIEIGTPGQKVELIYDTGSADLVVDPDHYKPKDSTTAKDLNKTFEIQYGAGAAHGKMYTDTVNIGKVEAKRCLVGRADKDSEMQSGDRKRGILGLSFASLSAFDSSEPTFPQAVTNQNLFQRNTYQFNLRKTGESNLKIGHVDKGEISGDFHYADVDPDDGYWMTDIDISGEKHKAIFDTGAELITAPNDDMKKILDAIDGVEPKQTSDGNWVGWFKCNDPPLIKIKIAGGTFYMKSDIMNWLEDGEDCRLPFTGMDYDLPGWLIGVPIYEMASVVHDFDKKRLGFGRLKYSD